MTPRKDESQEEFNARRRSKWTETRRTLNAEGSVTSTVEKRARGPETAVKIPDAAISRTSTLYDADGNVAQQWVQEKPEERAKLALWEVIAKALAEKLPRVEPIPVECPIFSEDLCVTYPVGDHHMGMLAWSKETGASYDLEIGERLLVNAFDHLTQAAPPAAQALIAVLGDYFHYDSFQPVTPEHRNILDADGRFGKMYDASVRTIRRAIDATLRRHRQVRVVIEIGNHDLTTSQTLAILLKNVYENEPRLTVDISPRHYHYFVFGRNLIATHHGHGTKLENLPIIMATDQAQAWSACPHRYWLTGHVHHDRTRDINGVLIDTFGILPPSDAFAANKGYRSRRGMHALVFHRRDGFRSRHFVTPETLEQGA